MPRLHTTLVRGVAHLLLETKLFICFCSETSDFAQFDPAIPAILETIVFFLLFPVFFKSQTFFFLSFWCVIKFPATPSFLRKEGKLTALYADPAVLDLPISEISTNLQTIKAQAEQPKLQIYTFLHNWKKIDRFWWNFFTVILPLLAVLVQSASIRKAKFFPTYKVTAEEWAEIKTEFDNLKNAFAAANIDPTEFYCEDRVNLDTINRIPAILGLPEKVHHFQYFVGDFAFDDNDFFCGKLIDSLKDVNENLPSYKAIDESIEAKISPTYTVTAKDLSEILTKFDSVVYAFAVANIKPQHFYCSEFWIPEVLENVLHTPSLNDPVVEFQELIKKFSLFPDEFFCSRNSTNSVA